MTKVEGSGSTETEVSEFRRGDLETVTTVCGPGGKGGAGKRSGWAMVPLAEIASPPFKICFPALAAC